jgi:hypothetical protein
MEKWKWYYKNGAAHETYTVLYDQAGYVVVKNDNTNKYSFGLKRDFGTLYGFPINQSCLTLAEIKKQLNAFIRIDKEYIPHLGEYAIENINRWNDMIASLPNS